METENKQYGYARVSTRDQNLDRQLLALRDFGVGARYIYADKASGKDFDRPEYKKLVRKLCAGDTLVIKSIDRLGRNYDEILAQWRYLSLERHVQIVVLDMPLLDTRARSTDLTNLIGAVEGSDLTLKNVTLYGRNLSGCTIDTAGKLTLGDGSNLTFGEISKQNAGVVNAHGSSAELVIEDGATVEKNTISANYSASVHVSDDATLTIKGGSIQNNTYSETHDGAGTAGVLVDSGATGKMTGGTTQGNTARRGAGLKLTGTESSNRTTFEISGGSIKNNTNTAGSTSMSSAGGAVYVSDNSSLTMNGGEISGNKGGNGGGVTIVDWKLQNNQGEYKTAFVMNGGTISGNSATNGGGIYSYSNGTELNAGTLSGNTASNMGGGIYVEGNSDYYSTTYMKDAFVTNNTAAYNGYSYSGIGGGLWLCPTGDTSSYIKNGGVINDNTADRAADDVASAQKFGKNYQLSLANRILGGGKVS